MRCVLYTDCILNALLSIVFVMKIFILLIPLTIVNGLLSGQPKVILEGQYNFSLPHDRGYENTFAYIDEANEEYLRGVFLKPKRASFIDIYDLTSGQIKQSIQLKGIDILSNFVRTVDKKFWVFDESRRHFVLFNRDGQIEKDIDEMGRIQDIRGPYSSYYGDLDFNPLVFHKDKIFLVSSLLSVHGTESDTDLLRSQGMIQVYDIKRDKFEWSGQIPSGLISHDYGYLNRFSTVVKNGNLVIAPFFSNEIMVYNLETENYVYPIIDSNYYRIVKPFSVLQNNPRSLKENKAANKHYFENPHYIGILYDRFRSVYYRIIKVPSGKFNRMRMRILVMDEYFRYKSIFDIPEDYVHKGMFVSEKGLNILNLSKYQNNTEVLTFDTFIFEENVL